MPAVENYVSQTRRDYVLPKDGSSQRLLFIVYQINKNLALDDKLDVSCAAGRQMGRLLGRKKRQFHPQVHREHRSPAPQAVYLTGLPLPVIM